MPREKTPSEKYWEMLQTKILPKSPITQYFQNRIGLYTVASKNYMPLPREQKDSSKIYGQQEKFVPVRANLEISSMPGVYNPLFLRHFQNGDITTAIERIVANNALRLYPTPLSSYGFMNEAMYNAVGVATIDLNHLYNPNTGKHVNSERLDHFLHSLGCPHEINSFKDFQNLLENPVIIKNCEPRFLVQLGLSTIFIPNAIGETDPNSRNGIILFNEDGKCEYFVRIDAEANTTMNDLNNTRSGNKVVPKGIFTANETQEEFLKAIKDKDKNIDWDLFKAFVFAAKEAVRRTNTDQRLTEAYLENSGRVDDSQFLTPNIHLMRHNSLASDIFPNSVADRVKRHFDNVLEAMGSSSSLILPFAESTSKYPGLIITDDKPVDMLTQEYYDNENNDITEIVLTEMSRKLAEKASEEVSTIPTSGANNSKAEDVEQ